MTDEPLKKPARLGFTEDEDYRADFESVDFAILLAYIVQASAHDELDQFRDVLVR